MAKNLLTTLIVTVYFPEVALLPDGMIIEHSFISDPTLDHLVDQFDREEQKTLFALYAQFNSTLVARYCRTVVELVFDFLSDDDRELWFKGLSRSLEALTPRRRTEATVLLNNPEASRAEVEAAGEADRALTAQIDAMVGRTPQLLTKCGHVIRIQAQDDHRDTTLFDATMRILNRSQITLQSIEWISSFGYDFALACHRNYNALNGPLVKHWLEDSPSGTDLDICMRELEGGGLSGMTKWRLALFASVWHRARVMTTNALDAEAKVLLDLCEVFATPVPRMEKYLDARLLDLFQHHKRYTAAVDSLLDPLITMGH
ncbi:hypothetical protein LTR84_011433 [Exophiala bonariae]|uniref:Uncharacterized protein n=1 Tax=Exophiala bonariae TaxID=1690606 RepID=A0AAV9MUJ9_9EURO|nr:hypothetical protein LTR84_011433 [Exophiala bonariae]